MSFLIACGVPGYDHYTYYKFRPNEEAQYFKDYDIYRRKGVDPIRIDSLRFPFFEVLRLNDSTIRLTHVKELGKSTYDLPTDDRMFLQYRNIKDGTTHNYFRIFEDRIVRFGYYGDIYTARQWPGRGEEQDSISRLDLIPASIEIATRDTLYGLSFPNLCFGIEVYEDERDWVPKAEIDQYRILPFSVTIDSCALTDISYFNKKGNFVRVFHYSATETDTLAYHETSETSSHWRDYYFRY